jgi:hypothetical protein
MENYLKKIWIVAIIVGLIISSLLSFGLSRYSSAKSAYSEGLNLLQSNKWDEARSIFETAKIQGVIYFQNGDELVASEERKYAEAEYSLAKQAFDAADFKSMESHLVNIPKRVELTSKINDLKNRNPLTVDWGKIIKLDGLKDQKIQYGILSEGIPAILIQGTDGEGINRIGHLYIIIYDPVTSSYKIAYQAAKQYFQEAKLDIFEPFKDTRKAVLASLTSYGASAYTSQYIVLAYDAPNQLLTQYLDITAYKSSTEFKNAHLIIHAFDEDTEYEWNGEQFSGRQIFLQPNVSPNDVIVHYSLNNKKPDVSSVNITLKLGQKLTFIRDDHLKVGKRLMLSSNGTVDFDQNSKSESFIAKAEGSTDITLVPNGGYDWGNAIKFTVMVVQ